MLISIIIKIIIIIIKKRKKKPSKRIWNLKIKNINLFINIQVIESSVELLKVSVK